MQYLTPKKNLSEIARERTEQIETQNLGLYEAIAELYEALAGLEEENNALKERVAELEGGQSS